jgi:pseudaminic acid synthase
MDIAGKKIGHGFPTYIVAEMSANHRQDLAAARQIVRAAKECGADAIKLQTYRPDTMTIDCDNDYFRIKGTIWEGQNLYRLYQEAHTPWEWQPQLKDLAESLGMQFFATPFDATAVDFLQRMEVPAYKIASFELVDLPLLRCVARTGKPVILSTGMATLGEIDEAVEALRAAGAKQIVLLKCTSAYPAPPEDMNLRSIPHLSQAFGLPVGLSDHTLGIAVPVAAVTLGACLIEKHFTLSRKVPGPDSAFSLEPQEFQAMVAAIRLAEKAGGAVHYGVSEQEGQSRVFRRSLFVVQDMKAGEIFTGKNIGIIRPAYGLHPRYFEEVLGRKAGRDIVRGTPLSWGLVG